MIELAIVMQLIVHADKESEQECKHNISNSSTGHNKQEIMKVNILQTQPAVKLEFHCL